MEADDIRNEGEEIIQYLLYLFIDAGCTLGEYIKNVQMFLLEKDLTKDQEEIVRKEMGFTKRAISNLKNASMHYRAMMKSLDDLKAEVETNFEPSNYDIRFADSNELIEHCILYIYRTHRKPKNELEIRKFLKQMEDGKGDPLVWAMCKYFLREF